MLAILSNGSEVIICEVDAAGDPITKDYFTGKDGDGRKMPTGLDQDDLPVEEMDDYTLERVEGPILLTADLKFEPERTLTSTA